MFRSQMKYHPRVGFTYMPESRTRVESAQGAYLVQTNKNGFRSDKEFEVARSQGTYRVLLFGDSQTAGDGSPNADRFSDRTARDSADLEVYNYGLSGSGPDQQLLVFEELANVEHDLVVIALYVENIRRVTRSIVKSLDRDGRDRYYAKPYFDVDGDRLILNHVPVPKKGWELAELPAQYQSQIYNYSETNFYSRDDGRPSFDLLRRSDRIAPVRRTAKDLALRISAYEPLPEYDSADDPGWSLLRRILERWLVASEKPVLIMPIPHHVYLVTPRKTRGYQHRLLELATDTGCHFFDPLPHFAELSLAGRKALWSDAAGHLSDAGHAELARLLGTALTEVRAACRSQGS